MAAWACVNLLAGTIASLPLMVYRTRGGARTVASDHPLYRILHDSPNADQTALDFCEFVCASLELHGYAYAEVVRARNGRIIALGVPITPELVTVRRLETGALEYEWVDQGRRIIAGQDRVLHIRGFGGNPLGGLSTLSAGRQSFGLAQAIDEVHLALGREPHLSEMIPEGRGRKLPERPNFKGCLWQEAGRACLALHSLDQGWQLSIKYPLEALAEGG